MNILPKVSTLVLDTRNIVNDGDINSQRSDIVFRNIDFDILLGEEWRGYDLFNIYLVSTVYDLTDHTDDDDKLQAPATAVPEVRLSGRPFVDSDLRVNTKTQEIALCTVDLNGVNEAAKIDYYPGGLTWSFTRMDRGLIDFYIRLVNPATNQIDTDSYYPHQQYIFKLYHL